MLRRLSITVIAALAMSLIGGSALAAPPQTDTRTEKNVVETFRDVIPTCDMEFRRPTHRITTTANLVEHSTIFDDGRGHFSFKQTGTFVARPLRDGGITYTGTFTVSGTFNENRKNTTGTFTFTVRGTGSDGSRFVTHFTDHFNSTPTGAEFFFTRCHD